jgi:hypothetical protein
VGAVGDVLVDGAPARALVDTAGDTFGLSQDLADRLGLAVLETHEQDGAVFTVRDAPEIEVGGYRLDTDGVASVGFDDVGPLGLEAVGADLLLPATVLRRHHVVLDLPAGELVVGDAHSLERRGVAVAASLTEVPMLAVEVDGRSLDLVLDVALPVCLAPDRVLRGWREAHPDWSMSAAAVGPGNVVGAPAEARVPMLRVPEVRLAGFTVPQVAFAWRGDADLGGADGALGRNALGVFRVDIDWSSGSVRLEQTRAFLDPDTDMVGVVLARGEDGWVVSATVTGLEGIRAGDLLVTVDGDDATDATLPEAVDLLRGEPGQRKRLVVGRDGDLVEVDAPVVRVL